MIHPPPLRLHHWIGGAATSAGRLDRFGSHDPTDPERVLATAPLGDADAVDAAVAAARAAFPAWRDAPGPERAARLHAFARSLEQGAVGLAHLIATEVGKPVVEAEGEVARAVALARYYAAEAVHPSGTVIPAQTPDTFQLALDEPLGVVGLITPWNFPLAIPLWKALPALAYGNTVVLKPSELSPLLGDMIASSTAEAHFPAGVFNVVHGDGAAGSALVEHPDVRAVSFTGSRAVGTRIAAACAARGVRCQAEMGGKNAAIVLADADLDRAAALVAAGAFRFAGQKCTATSRVIVVDSVREAFLKRLAAAAAAIRPGHPLERETLAGPLISAEAVARAEQAMAAHPAPELWGGEVPDRPGHWCRPRVVAVPEAMHPLAQEELFAPVLAVLAARDLDDAIVQANATPFGLSATCFTRDLHAAARYARRIEVGLVRINGDTTGVDLHAPFGGVKGSSYGPREQGQAARAFYTESRTLQIHA